MREPRAYDIEDAVFGGRFHKLRENREGLTVEEQRSIVVKILTQLDRLAPMPTVVRKRGELSLDSWAQREENKIFMGAYAGPVVVCHELAHLLAPPKSETGAWHSKQWEDAYVTCVRLGISDFHADRLAKAFEKARKTSSKKAAKRGVR